MKSRGISWRTQLVLVMILTGAIALGSFIAVSWQSVLISNYKKLDAELMAAATSYGRPFLSRMRPSAPSPHPQPPPPPASLDRENGPAFAFHDLTADNTLSSRNWPDTLDVRILAPKVIDLYASTGRDFHAQPPLPGPSSKSPSAWNTRPPPPPAAQPLPRLDSTVFENFSTRGRTWRFLGFSNGQQVFIAVRDLDDLRSSMAAFWRAVLLALPISLLLIGGAAWLLAGRALSPVLRLSAATERITAADMKQRLEKLDEPKEFAQLIEVYNGMLDRLESSFKQARRFSADAAHELNTPLTILQGHLDALLQDETTSSDQKVTLSTTLEETQHLQDIIRKLLLLSQADAGRLPVDSQLFDLSRMVSDILEDASIMAPGLSFTESITPAIQISGDQGLLRQCVYNLASNAIKYNRPDGTVETRLDQSGSEVILDVINSGTAIAAEHENKLFERFFRGDPAHTSVIKGRGLGLSLAGEFAKSHSGTLVLLTNEPDRICFRLTLPVSGPGQTSGRGITRCGDSGMASLPAGK